MFPFENTPIPTSFWMDYALVRIVLTSYYEESY